MLTELVRKRERLKLKSYEQCRDLLRTILCPIPFYAIPILERMRAMDRRHLLHYPVSAEDVPDYYDIIAHPMDFSTLESKIFKYEDFSEFIHDVSLIFTNCMTYNKPSTPYFRLARKIQQASAPWLAEAMEGVQRLHTYLQSFGERGLHPEEHPMVQLFLRPTVEDIEEEKEKEKEARVHGHALVAAPAPSLKTGEQNERSVGEEGHEKEERVEKGSENPVKPTKENQVDKPSLSSRKKELVPTRMSRRRSRRGTRSERSSELLEETPVNGLSTGKDKVKIEDQSFNEKERSQRMNATEEDKRKEERMDDGKVDDGKVDDGKADDGKVDEVVNDKDGRRKTRNRRRKRRSPISEEAPDRLMEPSTHPVDPSSRKKSRTVGSSVLDTESRKVNLIPKGQRSLPYALIMTHAFSDLLLETRTPYAYQIRERKKGAGFILPLLFHHAPALPKESSCGGGSVGDSSG